MVGVSETLKLIVTGDTSGAVRELKQLNAQTSKSLTDTTQKTSGLSKALGSINTGTLVAGFAVAGAAALKFGADAVKAAADDEVAHKRLKQAVENTGDSYEKFGGRIKGTEETLINLGFADDETASALARLSTATGDTGEALGQMGLAADIARGRNIGLGEATQILTKVAIGNVGALKRLGIATTDASGATISQEEAVKRLTQLYGGQAAAYSDTYAGKVAKLKAQFGELQETIGYALIPVIEDYLSVLSGGAGVLRSFTDAVGKSADETSDAGDFLTSFGKTVVFGPLIAGMQLFGGASDDAADSSEKLTNIQKTLDDAERRVAESIANGTQNTKEGQKAREDLTAAQKDAASITDGLAEVTDDAGQSIDDYRKALDDATDAQKKFRDAQLGIRANADEVEGDFLKFNNALKDYAEKAKDSGTSSDDLRLAQLDLQGQIRDTAKDAGDAAFEQAKLAGKSDAAGLAADAQRAAYFRLMQGLGPTDPLRLYIAGLITDLDKAGNTHANPTLDLTVSINGQKVPIAAVNSAIGAGGQFIRPAGRMAGGPVNAGQIYTVGEAGPELFMSTTGGTIVPNGRGISSGGGGGNTYQLTVVSIDPTKAGDAVVAALREYERSNGRVPIKVA